MLVLLEPIEGQPVGAFAVTVAPRAHAQREVGDAVGSVLTNLATVWVDVGTPNLTTSGNNPSDAVAFIQGSLWWYMAAAAVLSVTVGGARMAWTMRTEPGKDVSLHTLRFGAGAAGQ